MFYTAFYQILSITEQEKVEKSLTYAFRDNVLPEKNYDYNKTILQLRTKRFLTRWFNNMSISTTTDKRKKYQNVFLKVLNRDRLENNEIMKTKRDIFGVINFLVCFF